MNRFNLTTEHWIPLEGGVKASLLDMYNPETRGLVSGNAIQKISLYKLFFAIAQDAVKVFSACAEMFPKEELTCPSGRSFLCMRRDISYERKTYALIGSFSLHAQRSFF